MNEAQSIEIRLIRDRAEWLNWRRELLTASDIGAVAGVDPYRTPIAVYADKTGVDAPEETALMKRGRMFEGAAVDYLRDEHPDWLIRRPNHFLIDRDNGLGATPDAYANDDEGKRVNIQIKVVAAPAFAQWDGKPPQSYLMQTVCENMLADVDYGILAVLVVSSYSADLHEFRVPRHAAAEQRIREIARQFWDNMRAGLMPNPIYDRDSDLLASLFPPSPDVPVPLDLSTDNRIHALLETRETLKAEIKSCEEEIKALDAELIHKLAGAELAIAPGWKITHKLTHRSEYVVPAKSFPTLRVFKQAIEEAVQ